MRPRYTGIEPTAIRTASRGGGWVLCLVFQGIRFFDLDAEFHAAAYADGVRMGNVIWAALELYSDWTDDGALDGAPEWTSQPKYPISPARASAAAVKLKLIAEPAGRVFNLRGDGASMDFEASNLTATGAEQTVTLTSTGALPSAVGVVEDEIERSRRPVRRCRGSVSARPARTRFTPRGARRPGAS